jgi:hypothetical protein
MLRRRLRTVLAILIFTAVAIEGAMRGRWIVTAAALVFVVLGAWVLAQLATSPTAKPDPKPRPPYVPSGSIDAEPPPLLVRTAFWMNRPVPRPWRAWAQDHIERRYELDAAKPGGVTVAAARRRSALIAQGINPEDAALPPLNFPSHPCNWPDGVLYWFPIWFTAGALVIVLATVVITIVVLGF